MLSVTLYHIDRFHTGQPQAWLWIGVYVLFPPLMIIASVVQLRGSGSDATDPEPLPGWFRVVISLQAVVLAGVGVLLLAVPLTVAPHWPWTLSALTGRAIGAWLVGFGLAAGQSAIENDRTRVRNVALSSIVFAGLLFVAVIRFGGQIDWDTLTSWLFVIVLASVLLVGVVAISVLSRSENRRPIFRTAREEQ